jgi:copper oxidase (laccase) domain-containing protein
VFEVDLPGARVVFTTRAGGNSEGPYASRNLGPSTADESEIVESNLRQLEEELELPPLQLLDQVHGANLVELAEAPSVNRPIADGATTLNGDRALLITGADCPSVFLGSHSRLTALHCGWRPVASGLLERATRDFGDEPFDAVIGPGICMEHFAVGDEVVAAMGEDGDRFVEDGLLDLTGIIRVRLERAGARQVHNVERCTFCEPELFFSHRRDEGLTGRQAGVGWRI